MNFNTSKFIKLIIVLNALTYSVLCFSSWQSNLSFWNGFREIPITIDSSLIDSDLTDFPLLVTLSSSNFLFSEAQTDGNDIEFYSSTGEKLTFEKELYDSSAEEAILWVKVPLVSSSSDTIVYLRYGDKTETTDEFNTSGDAWDSSFVSVFHLGDLTTSTVKDFKGSNNGTKTNVSTPAEVSGKIHKAQSFSGLNNKVSVADSASLDISGNLGISLWFSADTPLVASGGTVSYDTATGHIIHTFTSADNFTPSASSLYPEILLVAGGGGGGTGGSGGGGGAGGVTNTDVDISAYGSPIALTVGAGGASATNGANSTFGVLSVNGGGRGGNNQGDAATGGSGGGGGGSIGTGSGDGAAGTAGQGNAGANGQGGFLSPGDGSGGGGAGAASTAQAGGAGLSIDITGSNVTYATGGDSGNLAPGGCAQANSGNGGGGNGQTACDGIVVINYPRLNFVSKGLNSYSLHVEPILPYVGTSNIIGEVNGTQVSTSFSSLSAGTYYHLAMSYDGSNLYLYLNGVQVDSTALAGAITTNNDDLVLGSGYGGDLDEVRISNSARSGAWIKAEYQNMMGSLITIPSL